MPTFTSFKAKSLEPCIKLHRLLKLSCRRPISTPSSKFRRPNHHHHNRRRRFRFGSVFRPSKRSREEMDRATELKSFAEREQAAPFPSPMTPAFIKLIGARHEGGDEEVEEACRSFENYLVEMIVEEGRVRDLTDVEELLHCWNSLKSPVFVELVSRFYGELCNDLFSGNSQYELLDDSMYE